MTAKVAKTLAEAEKLAGGDASGQVQRESRKRLCVSRRIGDAKPL